MTIETLTTLLGWTAIINIVFLLVSFFAVIAFKRGVISIHQKLFDVNEAELNRYYFSYLGQFKLLNLVFFVAPYIALVIMQSQ